MEVTKLVVIIVWGLGFLSFFKMKAIVKSHSLDRHDEIFGSHWTKHSLETTKNYLRLVFSPSRWEEFNSQGFKGWVKVALITDILAVVIVFYPLIRAVVALIFGT